MTTCLHFFGSFHGEESLDDMDSPILDDCGIVALEIGSPAKRSGRKRDHTSFRGLLDVVLQIARLQDLCDHLCLRFAQ